MRYIFIACAILIAYTIFYAGIVYMAKQRVVNDIAAAIEAGDIDAVESRIAYAKLRKSAQKHIEKNSKTVRKGDAIIEFGPEPEDVEVIVNHYIQPEFLAEVLKIYPDAFPKAKPKDFVHEAGFKGPFSFFVRIGYPISDVPMTMTERMSTITFIFRVNGLTWKADEMQVPLFMVPKTLYTTDQMLQILDVSNESEEEIIDE